MLKNTMHRQTNIETYWHFCITPETEQINLKVLQTLGNDNKVKVNEFLCFLCEIEA